MQPFDIKYLESSQSHNVMIGLGEAGIVIWASKVFEVVYEVNSKAEEDVVVDKDLLFFLFIRVQRNKVAIYNCYSSFDGSIKKIIVDFVDCSISLDALHLHFFWEALDNLELFIPVSDSFWI